MRLVAVLVVTLGLAAGSFALAAPTAAVTNVATKLQLRGHLPELGETPTMRVFLTANAYDTYHRSLGDADVFPPSGSLFMSLDSEILALYTRGNDSGGRCLRTGGNATFDADTVTLDLTFENGTCGAPSTAHYPFILVSVSRTAGDAGAWIGPGRQVCASPAGISRACASVPGGPSPSPTPGPTATATGSPSPSATPTASIASPPATSPPVATATATPAASPTRSPVAVASPTPPPDAGGGVDLFYLGALILGFVIGALVIGGVMSARSASRARRRD